MTQKYLTQDGLLHTLGPTRCLYLWVHRMYIFTTLSLDNLNVRLSHTSGPAFSTTKRVPSPNDTFSENYRRDVSTADLFWRPTLFQLVKVTVEISSTENQPRRVQYTPSYTVRAMGFQGKVYFSFAFFSGTFFFWSEKYWYT